MKKCIATFIVNARPHELLIEPHVTLGEVLRDQLDLTGTKFNCGVGECGACTVLVEGKPILSCSTLAITARDKNIVTIEALSKGSVLHPLQEAFIEGGAIQCGFCTSGMILSAKALLDVNSNPTMGEIKSALAGNLCRCTGYAKIVDAVLDAAGAIRGGGTEWAP
jgi:carbon-monoxide dehydrogenase small subunit